MRGRHKLMSRELVVRSHTNDRFKLKFGRAESRQGPRASPTGNQLRSAGRGKVSGKNVER